MPNYRIADDRSFITYTLSDGSVTQTFTQFKPDATDAQVEDYATKYLTMLEAQLALQLAEQALAG